MDFLSYADDITISCPSIHGLNIMLDICNQFACDNSLAFNNMKTVCIKFGESVHDNECVKFNDEILKWTIEVKRHL